MKIYFHGATGDVTGSVYRVKTKHPSTPVDCRLFQAAKKPATS
jgi:metallo-beta-lactamase family protein